MSYLDLYRARAFAMGTSQKERIENNLELDFESLVRRGADKINFSYKEKKYEGALIQPTKTQSETKIIFSLLGRKTELMPEGAIINYYDETFKKDRKWIVLNAETKSYYGYIKYKILELNYVLKYININGEEKTLPAHIVGASDSQRSQISEYFKTTFSSLVQLPDKHLALVIPATKDLKPDTKFIIGDEVWRYIDSDKISVPGVYYAVFYKTQRDIENDSIDEQIADINKRNNTHFISNYGEGKIIRIGQNNNNLSFELKRDGKIISSSAEITLNEETPIATIKNGNLIPEMIGTVNITVKDKESNFAEQFVVEILPEMTNYLFVIGDDYIPQFSIKFFRINSDLTYNINYDKTMLKITERDGGLEIEGLQKGETEITFSSKELKFIQKVKVSSMWM